MKKENIECSNTANKSYIIHLAKNVFRLSN